MKVLSIGLDRKLFEENSAVRQRIIKHGRLAEELHIIVFNKCRSCKTKIIPAADNVFIYPTNSQSQWLYVFDAIKIGQEIIKNRWLKIGSRPNEFIISTQDPFECGLVGWRLKSKFGIPWQVQVHTNFFSPYFKRESLLNKVRVIMAKFLIPKADSIRVVSQQILNQMKKNWQDKIANIPITVLPVLVDIEKIKKTPIRTNLHHKYRQFNFIILMASRLSQEKNIGLAIEAMGEIIKKYPKTGLVIVGEGPEKNNLKLKIQNLKLSDNVVIENWSNDLISYYKTADLFLLTSNYEGYPRTVIEALASACPVVMTDAGGAGEVIKNGYNGLVVPVGSQQALIEALMKIIADTSLRNKITAAAKDTINRQFTMSKEEYLQNYKKCWEKCFLAGLN